jgi:hypothetical protein
MDAALKLLEALRKDEGAHERAQMMAQMGRIIEAVRTFIPSERWPDVQAALRGETPVSQQTSQAVQGCAGMFTSAARCRRSATYRMKHNSPSASLWSAFPGSTGKTKRSSSTAEQRPETGGRQPL